MDQDIQGDEVTWEHLDYYVRRHGKELLLVETVLKQVADQDQSEIMTFYYSLEQLNPEWAAAVIEQGRHLEDNKSADFVPPDERIGRQRLSDEESV